MSQWADNTDRLNQWAESRRQFVGVHARVFVQGGEIGGEVGEMMLSGFLWGLLQVVKTSPAGPCGRPRTVLQPQTRGSK